MAGALPNLLIIGAMKCGTTALHKYLSKHPEIGMSSKKELKFFAASYRWRLGWEWYSQQFDPGKKVRGESSPAYSDQRLFPQAAERITAYFPDIKLIYLVRDPVDRIVADYRHRVTMDLENRSWTSFVEGLEGSEYVARSSYRAQLQPYLDHYPPERILVLTQQRLLDHRRETLRQAFRFLEVDEDFWSPYFRQLVHETRRRRRRTERGRRIGKRLDDWMEELPSDWGYRIGPVLLYAFSKPVPKPVVTPEERGTALSYLEEDIHGLIELCGPESHVGREARGWLERVV
jgi:hypothetical protein